MRFCKNNVRGIRVTVKDISYGTDLGLMLGYRFEVKLKFKD